MYISIGQAAEVIGVSISTLRSTKYAGGKMKNLLSPTLEQKVDTEDMICLG